MNSVGDPNLKRERAISFEGCFNARDLGGLRTSGSQTTRFGIAIRSDEINSFTRTDWIKLGEFGVRTIIDLRNESERKPDLEMRPNTINTVHIALDAREDSEFWDHWTRDGKWATPLYYRAHLERFPDLSALVLKTIAHSTEGGVLFHCGTGRDRTGLITALLLHLAGVPTEAIAEDHSLSHTNASRLYAKRREPDQWPHIEALMKAAGKTTLDLMRETLDEFDYKNLFLKNGITSKELDLIRNRFCED